MPNMDWRIKYYGVQALAFFLSLFILLLGMIPGLFSPDFKWVLWLALPLATVVGGVGWFIARRFSPHTSKHLSPREWDELRTALEDVPVISLFHVFLADRGRMERFRYIPFLERYLWERLAEEEEQAAPTGTRWVQRVEVQRMLEKLGAPFACFLRIFPNAC